MDRPSDCGDLKQIILELKQKNSNLEEKDSILQESVKKYQELMEFLPETIFELDMNFKVTFVNRNAYEIFGYSYEDFEKGINGLNIIAPVDRVRAAENIAKIVNGRVLGLTEYLGIRKDGSTFPVMIHSTAIEDMGRPVGIRGFIIDISEKKKREIFLDEAKKFEAIGVFASGIAHDFNNILSIIMGNIELVLANDFNQGSEKNLKIAIDACGRAKNLASQLMTFNRLKENTQYPFKINFIVKESLKLLSSITPKNIRIVQNVMNNSHMVFSDPTRVNQLITNLCMNAIHAMEEKGGTLNVTLKNVHIDDKTASQYHLAQGGAYVRLAVKDTGIGIDPEIKEKLFEPYFTTKENGKGTGLGLPVVYTIVKDANGGIKIDSEPGKGTVVDILLPAVIEDQKIKPKGYTENTQKNACILFVDDDDLIIDVSKKMLNRLGYDVEAFSSPIEALRVFKSDPSRFGLVLVDAIMPEMPGEKLIAEIHAIRSNVPVIISTGDPRIPWEQKAKKTGAYSVLKKPFTLEDMDAAIKEKLFLKSTK